jgi:hypothetical protein
MPRRLTLSRTVALAQSRSFWESWRIYNGTQKDAAKRMRISPSTMRRLTKNPERISDATMRKVSRAVGSLKPKDRLLVISLKDKMGQFSETEFKHLAANARRVKKGKRSAWRRSLKKILASKQAVARDVINRTAKELGLKRIEKSPVKARAVELWAARKLTDGTYTLGQVIEKARTVDVELDTDELGEDMEDEEEDED